MAQRRAAGVQQPWLRRQVTAQVTQPADACAAKVPLQRPAPVLGALAAAGQRQAGIKPRLHRQQHRQIRNVARHGARHAELLEEHLVGGPMRHAAHGGAQAIHVVERRGGAQRPHHVRAVGHRQHAQSHGHTCATAAAASRALWVKGVARGAVHGVEGVAAQAKLRRIGAGHKQCSTRTHALEHYRVSLGELPRKNGGAPGGHHAGHGHDVLGCLGKPVQGAQADPPGQLRVTLLRLGPQPFPPHGGHQGVDDEVEPVDLRQIRLQHLHTRHLPIVNGLGQCGGRPFHQVWGVVTGTLGSGGQCVGGGRNAIHGSPCGSAHDGLGERRGSG